MGRFPTLMGRFPECLNGPFSLTNPLQNGLRLLRKGPLRGSWSGEISNSALASKIDSGKGVDGNKTPLGQAGEGGNLSPTLPARATRSLLGIANGGGFQEGGLAIVG